MSKRILTLVVAAAFIFALVGVSTAKAATIEELTALIAQLQAQIAALTGGSTTAAGEITKDLTIGSRGDQVEILQKYLEDEGYLVMPVGVAYGYFGNLTKAAVAKWQADNGVTPSVGYFGPKSRAMYATLNPVTPADGDDDDDTDSGSGITTPGAEGTLTVTTNSLPSAGKTIREGDKDVAVLGLKLEAKLSDIDVQRVKVDLGSSSVFYTRLFDRIYVKDGDTVLAESPLNSSTVVKEGSTYYITLTGFSLIVPKGSTKVLTLALDAQNAIDSDYNNDSSYGLAIPANGVRGVDGAGINQTGPSTALSRRTVTLNSTTISEDAALKISLNSSTPDTSAVVADQGSSDDEYDKLPVLVFNAKAEKDDVKIEDLVVSITRGGDTSAATATTAYLYADGEVVSSASVVGTSLTAMTATFSDFDYIVSKDTTETFTVKLDIVDAGTTATTFSAEVASGANVTVYNTEDIAVTETGTASGRTISVLKEGLLITLASKSITTNGAPQNSTANSFSTSTLTATFNVTLKAMGADIALGTVASDTPVFAKTGATNSFALYKDGVASSASVATSTAFAIPSTCTSFGTNSCTLYEGSEVTIPVTFQIPGRTAASAALDSGIYSVGLVKVNWGNGNASTFMNGNLDWVTTGVSFP